MLNITFSVLRSVKLGSYSERDKRGFGQQLPDLDLSLDFRTDTLKGGRVISVEKNKAAKTEGPAVVGSASRRLGGRDSARPQSDKWIPPSATRRDALPENNDDVKFRKVRGILNKLTPETFDRLTEELIRVGLDSPILIKGAILLIFEKALQEKKYVSLYAQLCQRLSRKVPNFDPPSHDNTTTFRRFLLAKCQDEFANRAWASAMYDRRRGNLTPEEEEEKLLAKHKMLGNIKFIGELGKLEMLGHSILHKCCEELVKKTKAEDLECLCQIMSTCGHLLDNNKGRYLMDQYFHRMKELCGNEKLNLPSRIRFMLLDVIELRENQWLPRKTISQKELPKPIQEIRRDAKDELGILPDDPESPSEDFCYLEIEPSPRRNVRGFGPKKKTGLEDVFAPLPAAMSSLGTGPGTITAGELSPRLETNGFVHSPSSADNYRPAGGMRGYKPLNTPPSPYYRQHKTNMNHYHNNNHDGHHCQMNIHSGYGKSPVAPRFSNQAQHPPYGKFGGVSPTPVSMPAQNEKLSLRPSPNSVVTMMPPPPLKPSPFVPHILGRKSPSAPVLSPYDNKPPPPTGSPLMQLGGKCSVEGKKMPSKDDVIGMIEDIVSEFLRKKSKPNVLDAVKKLSVPEKLSCDVIVAILKKAMIQNEADREAIYSLIVFLVDKKCFSVSQFQDAFRTMLDLMADLEADIPPIKSQMAALAGRAIRHGQLTLAKVAELTENGKHYPFLLLVLQQMEKTMEGTKLSKLFEESKVNLLTTFPKMDRTLDRISKILEERNLSFIFPLIRIQAEMSKRLQENLDPMDFLKWIKEEVDVPCQASHGFIHALMTVIFQFISAEALKVLGIEGIPTQANEKEIKEQENALLLKYKPVISMFLQNNVDLQVVAIYALQSAWFALECPKVMLLRWFMNTYDLDIIEEDAFLKWKEDVRDNYPGKGKALFQVNQWLNWLEEDEDED